MTQVTAFIPSRESLELGRTVREASGLAGTGHVLLGFRHLIGGLEHAQEALDQDETWAPSLVEHYHAALKDYAARHGLPLR